MATYLENLVAARDDMAAEWREINRPEYIRKPSYSLDGQSVDWEAYRDGLWRRLKEQNDLIADGGDYFEEVSELY